MHFITVSILECKSVYWFTIISNQYDCDKHEHWTLNIIHHGDVCSRLTHTYLWLKIFYIVVCHYSLAKSAIQLISSFFNGKFFHKPTMQWLFFISNFCYWIPRNVPTHMQCTPKPLFPSHPNRIDIKPTLHNNTKICLLAIYYCQFWLLLFINVLWTNVEFENFSDLNIVCSRCCSMIELMLAYKTHNNKWKEIRTVEKKKMQKTNTKK